MPFEQVMHKFKKGHLHSGSKTGKKVTDKKQAVAIMLSEKREGKSKIDTGPSKNVRKKHGV